MFIFGLLSIIQLKAKPGQNEESVTDESHGDELVSPKDPVHEIKPEPQIKSESRTDAVDTKPAVILPEQQNIKEQSGDVADMDNSDEGWQEAFSKAARKSSSSRKPNLAKINTNFQNVSQSSKYRSKSANFTSPRTNATEPVSSTGPPPNATKKYVKSQSFSPKPTNPSNTNPTSGSNSKSNPSSPASNDQVVKRSPVLTSISVKEAGKHFSYKEVALAAPGTIVKAVAEKLPKDPSAVTAVETEKEPENENIEKVDKEAAQGSEEDHKNTIQQKKEESEAVEQPEPEKSESKKPEPENPEPKIPEPKSPEPENPAPEVVLKSAVTENPDSSKNVDNDETDESKETEDSESGQDGPKEVAAEKSPSDGENGKETTKKLSAAAPPFNPSNIPIFGSLPIPLKDHAGILPPPVSIPTMVTVNPARRTPHQSATARVPYGPRLSGGYNRSANRVPRNKPTFEHVIDGTGSHLSPPKIMNPHAAEFVPGQPWVHNGYLVSPEGYPISPNGYTIAINGFPPGQTGYPVSPVDSAASPVSSVESPSVITHEAGAEIEENNESNAETVGQTQSEIEEKPDNVVESSETAANAADEEPIKRWGDYSDGEPEVFEVAS